jgi:hypothetical protein
MDDEYDYNAHQLSPEERAFQQYQLNAPPPPPPPLEPPKKSPRSPEREEAEDDEEEPAMREQTGEEALLDLAQLEELHHEAEKMKALGNKHMAAQVSFFVEQLQSEGLKLTKCRRNTGIYEGVQCLFCCFAAIPGRSLIPRFLVESSCCSVIVEALCGGSDRC